MNGRGKNLVSLAQTPSPRAPLKTVTNLLSSTPRNSKYDIGTMRSSLDSLKTPSKLRRLDEKDACINDSNKTNNNTDQVEGAEEAIEQFANVEVTENHEP